MKKFLIFFLMLLPLAIASCGGDDNDEPDNGGGNGNNESISESTEYIATEAIKTITLKPEQEYMLFKNFYWKHKILLSGSAIIIRSYYGGGNEWSLYNNTLFPAAAIEDRGSFNDINEITGKLYYGRSQGQGTEFNGNKRFLSATETFRPNHGYIIGFRLEDNSSIEIKNIRLYPTNFSLDNNDKLVSVTIKYQLIN